MNMNTLTPMKPGKLREGDVLALPVYGLGYPLNKWKYRKAVFLGGYHYKSDYPWRQEYRPGYLVDPKYSGSDCKPNPKYLGFAVLSGDKWSATFYSRSAAVFAQNHVYLYADWAAVQATKRAARAAAIAAEQALYAEWHRALGVPLDRWGEPEPSTPRTALALAALAASGDGDGDVDRLGRRSVPHREAPKGLYPAPLLTPEGEWASEDALEWVLRRLRII